MHSARTCIVLMMGITVFVCLPACYRIVKPDAGLAIENASPAAAPFLSVIEQKNRSMRSFKGIGKIRVWDSDLTKTVRAAWVGTTDGRLRIEFLGLPGQSAMKFIFDGNRYTFFSPIDGRIYARSSDDPNLAPITGVSIKASEVIDLLAGGIPLYSHDAISIEEGKSADRHVIIFKKTWLGVVEKIFFSGNVPDKVEVYRWGEKIYQAHIRDVRNIDGHPVPFRLAINNAEGRGFSFDIDRQWVGIDVSPHMFEITQMD